MRRLCTHRGGPSVPFTDAPPGFLPRAKPRGRPSVRPSSLSPTRRLIPKISNRESIRLETHLTQRKERTDTHSNRENNTCFSTHHQPAGSGLSTVSATAELSIQPGKMTIRPQNVPRGSKKLSKNPKTLTPHPSFMFRLKPTAIVCFLQLTKGFNRTTFRLRRTIIERRNQKNRSLSTRREPKRPLESGINPRNARFPESAPPLFRVAFSPVSGYPRRHLKSRRRPACD
jgi:hypothetical protein